MSPRRDDDTEQARGSEADDLLGEGAATGEHHRDDLHHDEVHPDDLHPDDLHHDDVHPDDLHHDDVLFPGADPVEHHSHRRRHKRSPLVRWGALLVALAVVVGGGWFGFQAVRSLVPSFDVGTPAAEDYEGPGTGEVSIDIPPGAGGGQIGALLAEADVVASAEAFTAVAAVDDRSAGIQPGNYSLREQMSAQGALDLLLDPSARNSSGVTVREGLWKAEVFEVLAQATGGDVADYEAVTPQDLGLPEGVSDVEGYLFPDTYEFSPTATPREQLQAMVDLGAARFAEAGVEGDIDPELLTRASLIEAEANRSDDLPRVAQVIENRLEEGMPLGFDSTIHYMFQERGRAGTTDEQRATEDPYNTYLNTGLPPGPINNPGVASVGAALNPEEGPWLYFVTVDPGTGETNFAVTFAEHEENVALFQQWCRDNPDSC